MLLGLFSFTLFNCIYKIPHMFLFFKTILYEETTIEYPILSYNVKSFENITAKNEENFI